MALAAEADYLVIGAGASGIAFADALTRHADVRVALVDRRSGPGGHWLDAYPFVRLHQASAFYGVASTVLGSGSIQQQGPEAGLHERAGAAEVCAYYQRVLDEQLVPSGRVEFHANCEYLGDGSFVSRLSGARYQAGPDCRIVDARYLGPEIPATTAPPFGMADGVRVLPVHELPRIATAPEEFVIVGSGKTATDTCVWLLGRGVDPGSICWVRPREPWMLNRAVVQPNPAVFTGMAADIMEAASVASSPDDLFLRMVGRSGSSRVSSPPPLPSASRSSGLVASLTSVRTSVVSGGLACVAGALVVSAAFPALIAYDKQQALAADGGVADRTIG